MSEASIAALSGPEKAAVLLLSFSSEKSAELISRLSPREAEVLADQLARVREIDAGTRRRVLADFRKAANGPGLSQAGRHPPSSRPETATPPDGRERAAAGGGEGNGVRPYNFADLDRVPRPSPAQGKDLTSQDFSRLDDLPIRCRAEVTALPLALADLQHLTAGDVLLLGPACEASVHLVGGQRCRLPCRLLGTGQHRAVELLRRGSTGEGQ